jgi:hypothetical protein
MFSVVRTELVDDVNAAKVVDITVAKMDFD